jgi:hypothetical protein
MDRDNKWEYESDSETLKCARYVGFVAFFFVIGFFLFIIAIVLAPLPAAFPMPISVPIRSRSVVTNNELLISVDVVLVFAITAFYNLDRG